MEKAMTDLAQTGARAAAKEIICLPFNHRNGTRVNLKFLMQNEEQGTTESIEAIISKHSPDKAVGKLVEVLQKIAQTKTIPPNDLRAGLFKNDRRPDWLQLRLNNVVEIAKTFIAEYEGKQKEDDDYETFVRNQEK